MAFFIIYTYCNLTGKRVYYTLKYHGLSIIRPDFIIASQASNDFSTRKYGVINVEGHTVIPFIYDDLSYMPNQQWLRANKEDRYGMIDGEGQTTIDFTNDHVFFEDGLAQVYDYGREGINATTGKETMPVV